VIGVTELEGVVRSRGVGWVIVWLGSHMTGVRSQSGVGVFEYLTPTPASLLVCIEPLLVLMPKNTYKYKIHKCE
jgi:hypothetical protein